MNFEAKNNRHHTSRSDRRPQLTAVLSKAAVAFLSGMVLIIPAVSLAQLWQEPGANTKPPFYDGGTCAGSNPPKLCSTDADCTPPDPGSCSAPEVPFLLNGGNLAQRKAGSLIIGRTGGASRLCLNASADGANDASTCVSSWDEAIGLTGNYLRLSSTPLANGADLNNYTVRDSGYFRLQAAAGENQLYSLYVDAVNTAGSRGLFALDNVAAGTSYAAYFSGHLRIENNAQNTQLCLNGEDTDLTDGRGCITNWYDLLVPPGSLGLVKLQAGPAYASTCSGSPDQCGSSNVSGTGFMGSMTAGPTIGLSLAHTCGDGVCSGNTAPPETTNSCPLDCGASEQPLLFTVTPWVNSNKITITSKAQQSGNPINLLIVGRSDAAPLFQPQQGSAYFGGTVFGVGSNAETVIASLWVPGPGVTNIFYDFGLGNGTTYYYTAWQGNRYPRYGYPGVVQTGQPNIPVTLTVAVDPPTSGIVIGSPGGAPEGDGIVCPDNCQERYAKNSSASLNAEEVVNNWVFLRWGGACSGQVLCNLVMDSDKQTTAYYALCGDGLCSGSDEASLCPEDCGGL